MVTIIGKDNTIAKENQPIKMKCKNCGTIFSATLDDFALWTINGEYKLRIKCPDCTTGIFFNVEEDKW